MENTLDQQELVLGNEPISIKETIESICQTFNIKQWFRVRIPLSFILGLAAIFRIKIGPWERYYMKNPHLIYQTVTPSTFGLKTEFETIKEAIMDIKTHFFSKET